MPLNDAQKTIIDNIIQYFFDDFSTEAKILDQQIKNLQDAFENKIEEKNDLYQFQQCIFQPEYYLRRLEDYNSNITFKNVQDYILEYATSKVTAAAQKIQFQLEWPRELFQAFLMSFSKYNTAFKSKPLAEESKESPWDIPVQEGRTFRIVTEFKSNPIPQFKLELKIDEKTEKTSPLVIKQPQIHIRSTADEARVRERIKADAVSKGEILAGEITLLELMKRNIIDEKELEEYDNLYESREKIEILLTYQYYLNMIIKTNKIGFFQIRNIKSSELEILTNPVVIHGLERDLFNFQKAKLFSMAQVKLLSNFYYSKLIFSKELSINLSQEECKNLILPATVNLVQMGKIKLNDAIKMSVHSRSLLANEFYYNLLVRDKLAFSQINSLKEGEASIYLNPVIIQQISNGFIKIEDIRSLPQSVGQIIESNPLVLELINFKILELMDLKRISYQENHFFKNDFGCADIKEKLIKFLNKTAINNKIKILMKEFIVLADKKILHSGDLQFLTRYIDSIIFGVFNGDQFNAYKNRILSYPEIIERCKINLKRRLEDVFELKTQTADSIEIVEAACAMINVSFKEIAEKALFQCLHRLFRKDHDVSLDKLIKYSDKWNGDKEYIYANAFSIRILNLIKGKKTFFAGLYETEENILIDLKALSTEKLSMKTFGIYLFEQLHYDLKLQFPDMVNLDEKETPEQFKQIYKKLDQNECKLESLNEPELRHKIFINSFQEIAQIAKSQIEKPPLSKAREEKKEAAVASSLTTTRSVSFSFFSFYETKEAESEKTHILKYLSTLPKLLGIEKCVEVLEYKK